MLILKRILKNQNINLSSNEQYSKEEINSKFEKMSNLETIKKIIYYKTRPYDKSVQLFFMSIIQNFMLNEILCECLSDNTEEDYKKIENLFMPLKLIAINQMISNIEGGMWHDLEKESQIWMMRFVANKDTISKYKEEFQRKHF